MISSNAVSTTINIVLVLFVLMSSGLGIIDQRCNPMNSGFNCTDLETRGYVVQALWRAQNLTGNLTYGMLAEANIRDFVPFSKTVPRTTDGGISIFLALWDTYDATNNGTYVDDIKPENKPFSSPSDPVDDKGQMLGLMLRMYDYRYGRDKPEFDDGLDFHWTDSLLENAIGTSEVILLQFSRGRIYSTFSKAVYLKGLWEVNDACTKWNPQLRLYSELDRNQMVVAVCKSMPQSLQEVTEREMKDIGKYRNTPLDHAAMTLALLRAYESLRSVDPTKAEEYRRTIEHHLSSNIRHSCNPNGRALERQDIEVDKQDPDFSCDSMKEWAWMVMAYAEAYRVTGNETYKEIAIKFLEDAHQSAIQAPPPTKRAPTLTSLLTDRMLQAQIKFYGGLVLFMVFSGLAIHHGKKMKEQDNNNINRADEDSD